MHKYKISSKYRLSKQSFSPYLLTGIPLTLTLLSASILTLPSTHADASVVDEINITVPVSCSLTGVVDTVHNAEILNGTYSGTTNANGIGQTTLTTYCNDNSGYAIYAIGYTNNEYGNTKLYWSEAPNTNPTLNAIDTGIYKAGTTTSSTWSMKLNSNPGTYAPIIVGSSNDTEKETNTPDFSNFTEVPTEYTKVAYFNSSAGQTTGQGSSLTTTYDAYISNTQPAGTYTGQVKYTLVHPALAPAPVVCRPEGTTITTIACMQDITATNKTTILASMTEDADYTLKDSRDGKVYHIAKLKDGNIWMTQNLDHDIVATADFYTNENTDIGYNATTGQYETTSWTPSSATMTNASSWVGSNTAPQSYDPGDLYWNGTKSDSSDWDEYNNTCTWNNELKKNENCDESKNPISTYTTVSGTPIPQYHLGNFYNFTAALAMNDSSSYTTGGTLIERSICPAGWTLPRTGNGEDTFYSLWNKYNLIVKSYIDSNANNIHDTNETALWTSPLYFTPSGTFDGALYGVGRGGGFWSPVVYGSSYARRAYFGVGGYVSPSGSSDRGYGGSVRCASRPVSGSVSVPAGGGGAQ